MSCWFLTAKRIGFGVDFGAGNVDFDGAHQRPYGGKLLVDGQFDHYDRQFGSYELFERYHGLTDQETSEKRNVLKLEKLRILHI